MNKLLVALLVSTALSACGGAGVDVAAGRHRHSSRMAMHWIPDVETPDLIRGRDDNYQVRDDKTKGRGHSRTRDIRGVTHCGALGHR